MSKFKTFDEFLTLFPSTPRVKIANGFNVRCPAHKDYNPSLSLALNNKTNNILLKCQAGCGTEAVCKSVGISEADLFLNNSKEPEPRKVVATYDYVDANGKLLHQVVRYEPKTFSQRQPDGNGGWILNLQGVETVLYNLPKVIEAVKNGIPIYLVEGEKDADTLTKLGYIATTNPMGAGKWKPQYTKALEKATVVLVPDTDEEGRKHGERVANELFPVVKSLKVIELQGAKDITEWFDNGGVKESFDEFVKETAPYSVKENTKELTTNVYNVYIEDIRTQQGSPEANRNKNATENATSTPDGQGKTQQVPLAKRIEDWVTSTSGWFDTPELDRDLGILSTADKNNRRETVLRLEAKGIVERHPKISKQFRYINNRVTSLDFKTAGNAGVLPIKWPLGIEKYVNIFPGNLAVVAGATNAGKTAFLLNFIYLNDGQFPIYYFCSEMGGSELNSRLRGFEDVNINEWNFKAIDRSSNFEDVIVPDAINVVDYLEMTDDLWEVNTHLTAISHKVGTGLAIVAIQKKVGEKWGRGQEFSAEKSKIYLSMDEGRITIVKGKSWVEKGRSPNGLRANFEIVNGCYFTIEEDWHRKDN